MTSGFSAFGSTMSTASTGYTGGFTMSAQTNPACPILPMPPVSPRHCPELSLSCAQADMAADQIIDGLDEELHKPCPHCGKVRDPGELE